MIEHKLFPTSSGVVHVIQFDSLISSHGSDLLSPSKDLILNKSFYEYMFIQNTQLHNNNNFFFFLNILLFNKVHSVFGLFFCIH